ncbi:MAG: type II 3-dehydroquinate dehydratase [Oscillospiraceae bacterium]|nr:type II 3-dehydroquinate dehydratase [Oscillospiraceae bacterium]
MKYLILNGPNINMLGIREPDIYGRQTYDDMVRLVSDRAEELGVEVEFYQSNHEGDLVDAIQKAYFDGIRGIVFNPAAYTHTSVAIADAVKGVAIPTVEVHISDVSRREAFRQISYIGAVAVKTIKGQGLAGYVQALEYLVGSAESAK